MRHIIELKDGWQFTNLDGQTSEVSIPHTWNAIDGQDGGDDYKRTCHDSALHVPLVIAGGPFRGGRRASQAVSLVDFAPTLLELAGADAGGMDGRSFAAMARADVPGWDEDVFIQISESEVARALRTPRYKYCVTAPHRDPWRCSDSEVYVESCLYDLQADPS